MCNIFTKRCGNTREEGRILRFGGQKNSWDFGQGIKELFTTLKFELSEGSGMNLNSEKKG